MILSELLTKKLGHVDVIVDDVIIIVVVVIFVLFVFLFTMTLPLSLEGWKVEAKMVQFENYVNDHLRYYKDQVRKIIILILMKKMMIMMVMIIIMIVTNMLQDHIMFTMGDDFQYQNAVMNYKNMDKVLLLITISSSMKRAMDICEILGQHT